MSNVINKGFEPFLERIQPYIKDVKVVFDIGARDCVETAAFAQRFPQATVVGFEPNPEQTSTCLETISQVSNAIFSSLALSDKRGEMDFFITEGNIGASSLLRPQKVPWTDNQTLNTVKVNVTTLDEWCAETNKWPDIIWMDVQGNELNVLKGSEKALQKVQAIYCEAGINPYYDGHTLKPDIVAFLQQRGFKVIADEFEADDATFETNLTLVRV